MIYNIIYKRREIGYTPKKQLEQLELERLTTVFSSKKQSDSNIRNRETDCSGCVETQMGQKGVQIRFFRPRKRCVRRLFLWLCLPFRPSDGRGVHWLATSDMMDFVAKSGTLLTI